MDLGLKGKTALVTGSTEGIGYATAKALAKEGADVYINGRTAEKVRSVIQKLQKEGAKGKLLPAACDVSDEKSFHALIKQIPHLDILVNNVGIYEVKPFQDISDEDWLHLFDVNVMSGIRLCRAYFQKMIKKNWGRIIFVSSESGVNIPAEMIHYGMTKTAQLAIARGLAELTAGTQVTVNSVLPGPTYSTGVESFVKDIARSKKKKPQEIEKEFFSTLRPSSLIKRFATTDEVAALIAFVCSPQAAAINGASLRVEGGVIRSIT